MDAWRQQQERQQERQQAPAVAIGAEAAPPVKPAPAPAQAAPAPIVDAELVEEEAPRVVQLDTETPEARERAAGLAKARSNVRARVQEMEARRRDIEAQKLAADTEKDSPE